MWALSWLVATGEVPQGLFESLHQAVHFLLRIIYVEAGPPRGDDIQHPHERHRTVVPGPYGDSLPIQDGADVVGVHVGRVEGDDSSPSVRVPGPEDVELFYLP